MEIETSLEIPRECKMQRLWQGIFLNSTNITEVIELFLLFSKQYSFCNVWICS